MKKSKKKPKKSIGELFLTSDEQLNNIKNDISVLGFSQDDKRLGRRTQSICGYSFSSSKSKLVDFYRLEVADKYQEDYKRMSDDLNYSYELAKEDMNSRQLIIDNFNDRETVPCFNTFQFLYNGKDFSLQVYQRSQDLTKWKSDIRFFMFLMEEFEQRTGYKVNWLNVFYGNIHYETT